MVVIPGIKRIKQLGIFALIAIVFFGAAAFYQIRMLNKAHSSFEDYYAFRGCTTLLERADTYGICKTGSGSTIKIVKYEGKWYLDGDLPCKTGICL